MRVRVSASIPSKISRRVGRVHPARGPRILKHLAGNAPFEAAAGAMGQGVRQPFRPDLHLGRRDEAMGEICATGRGLIRSLGGRAAAQASQQDKALRVKGDERIPCVRPQGSK